MKAIKRAVRRFKRLSQQTQLNLFGVHNRIIHTQTHTLETLGYLCNVKGHAFTESPLQILEQYTYVLYIE